MPLNKVELGICNRFKKTRLEEGLTSKQMAKELRVNESYIKAVEQKRYTPNFRIMIRWSKRFKKAYAWIIEGKTS